MLAECNGSMAWPQWGVYFFFERSEMRSDSGDGPRVVRVGTHSLKLGSDTTLWNRLSMHRGLQRSGGGNHRASIFRLLVGAALKSQEAHLACDTWGQGTSAPADVRRWEVELEERVSACLGQMSLLVLGIDDAPGPDSKRGYVERNCIALLSNSGKETLDPSSVGWLGLNCQREKVLASGLWNQNHVDEKYDPEFLDILDGIIRAGV
jgi:hypothetical protein